MSPTDVHRLAAPGTLTDRATEAITRLVLGGEYPPRARLPTELELGRRLGVSRTVVREAVARLKSAGLVESRQGSGVFVREPHRDMRFRLDPGEVHRSPAAVLEILELRRCLEAEAAALAAERCSRAQVAELRRALAAIAREEAAGRDGVQADIELHRAIARASGNRHFPALWDFVGQFLRAAIQATRANEARRTDFIAQVRGEHRALVDAIARGSPADARAAALRHMAGAAARLREAGPDFWAAGGGAGAAPTRRRATKRPARPPQPREAGRRSSGDKRRRRT